MASPDPIDIVVKLIDLGKEIRKRYKIYTHAEADLAELDSRLHASLFVLDVFQNVLKRGLSTLLRRQQEDIIELFDHLQRIFDRLDKQLSQFPRDDKWDIMGRLRWTFMGKSGYEGILQEMATWRSELHDVIDAIKFLQEEEKEENRALYKQLFEKCGGAGIRSANKIGEVIHSQLEGGFEEPTPTSELIALLPLIGDDFNVRDENRIIIKGRRILVEYRYFKTGSPDEIEAVNKLAIALQQVDARSTHILHCRGTIHQGGTVNRSLLFYDIPTLEPRSKSRWTLAQAMEDRRKPSLNDRVRYAVEIAKAVMFTHAAGLVHKSIRAESVIILQDSPVVDIASSARYSAYLVGFDTARFDDLSAHSEQDIETDPMRRFYQHPERQILLQDGKVMRFGIQHDMYSLGIVLLELALWMRIHHVNDLSLVQARAASNRGKPFDPREVQILLAQFASQSLVSLIGTKYADVVQCCLRDTVLDQKTEHEMREVFYEQVLLPLRQIVL